MYSFLEYKKTVDSCIGLMSEGYPIAVIDLETTGLSATKNFIFEFAGIKVIMDKSGNWKIIDKMAFLINPAEPLSEKITEVTGFTNEDVKNRPSEAVMFPKIKEFMKDTILCAHNAKFEKSFMDALYERYGERFSPVEIIDTLKMSRDLHKEEKSHKLIDVAGRYGIGEGVSFHDARDDTKVCFKILKRLINEYMDFKTPESTGKIIPKVFSVRYWKGNRYDQQRLYVATDCGTIWWSVVNHQWGEKDRNTIDGINMGHVMNEVLRLTKCSNMDELSKFRG